MLCAERQIKPQKTLSETFIIDLKNRIFKGVWRWDGVFLEPTKPSFSRYQIGFELRMLLNDFKY